MRMDRRDRPTNRQTENQTYKQKNREDGQIDRETDRQREQTDRRQRKADRQTDRQKDRQRQPSFRSHYIHHFQSFGISKMIVSERTQDTEPYVNWHSSKIMIKIAIGYSFSFLYWFLSCSRPVKIDCRKGMLASRKGKMRPSWMETR